MAERRRWADVWHASSRDEAVARVVLLSSEYVVAAIPGDRKWCVLVERRDPRDLLRLEAMTCRCGEPGEEVIGDEDQEQLAVAGDNPAVLARYVAAEWRGDLAIGNVEIRRGHWRYRLVDPCEDCDGQGTVTWRDDPVELCWTCSGVGAALVLMEDTPALFWHDDPDGHTWVHGEVLRADDPNVWRDPAGPLTHNEARALFGLPPLASTS